MLTFVLNLVLSLPHGYTMKQGKRELDARALIIGLSGIHNSLIIEPLAGSMVENPLGLTYILVGRYHSRKARYYG